MFESNKGKLLLASPSHVYSSPAGSLTADLAKWLGSKYVLITAGPHTLQGQELVVKAAGSRTGFYTKTDALASKSALPEAAYAHKLGGSRKFDTTWNVYSMQPDNADWKKYHLGQLQGITAGAPWVDTFFSDSVVLSYSQGGHPAKPTAFTQEYTLREWLALEDANIKAWELATGKLFVMNGFGVDVFTAMSPRVAMRENAFRSNSQGSVLPSLTSWQSEMKSINAAQQAGFTPWLYIKLFGATAAQTDQWRKMAVPSAMIADMGHLLFELGGSEGSLPVWQTFEANHKCYDPNIGVPVDATTPSTFEKYLDPSGAYVKLYTGGVVIANPTTAGVSVRLSDGSTHPVDASSGLILQKTVAWNNVL